MMALAARSAQAVTVVPRADTPPVVLPQKEAVPVRTYVGDVITATRDHAPGNDSAGVVPCTGLQRMGKRSSPHLSGKWRQEEPVFNQGRDTPRSCGGINWKLASRLMIRVHPPPWFDGKIDRLIKDVHPPPCHTRWVPFASHIVSRSNMHDSVNTIPGKSSLQPPESWVHHRPDRAGSQWTQWAQR